ncbi:hypothetical protein BST81_11640 [Leptolyngbya sp. 'hensonii']|uniref:tetratricopeptide repeat protein n=1 Tax=Leptolyngbya sp. 'hensonii' TaxID=1922337 RepID=UPI00094FDD5B|nr:hypothetical protein BST81_11640 [Leptolyngbya sp. 'hensonii']
MALVNNHIARIEVNQGNLTEAIKRYKQSLDVYPDSEDKHGYASILYNLGRALLDQGDYLLCKCKDIY